MRIDIDSYREILDTLTRNKARSFLTGFGVFWGVFMLIGLMGGGKGDSRLQRLTKVSARDVGGAWTIRISTA